MGFEIRKAVDVLPFLRLNKTRKTSGPGKPDRAGQDRQASWTWHVGPWRYDTRTGRHTFKLGRSFAYKSKPRGKVAAARVAKVRARHPDWTPAQVAERAGVTRATTRRCIRRANRKRDRAAWDAAWQRHLYGDGASPTAPSAGAASGTTRGSGRRSASVTPRPHAPGGRARVQPREAGHVEGMQAAGLCGAITTSGGRCRNKGDCPHHGTAARAAAGSAATP